MRWLDSPGVRYRPLLLVFAGLLLAMVASALLYMLGMARFEGEERGFWRALAFAAETITTTGYGGDTLWRSPVMVLFVIALQIFGVMLIYMVIPLVLIPVLEARFESRLPTRVDNLSSHVVVVRYGPSVESLLDELARAEVPTVVIETEEPVERRLISAGRRTVHTASVTNALARVGLTKARSLIANGGDEENVSVILAARQLGYQGEILALVEQPAHRRPMQLAGATAVFTPKVMLAATLAARASARLAPRVQGMQEIGSRVRLAEIRVEATCALAGKTLAEAAIGERTGTTIVGQWIGGKLVSLPSANMRIEPRGILIAIGEAESLGRLTALATASDRPLRSGPLVIAGFGEVGRKVVDLLAQVDEPMQVIDRIGHQGVDLVGDVLDPGVLLSADLDHARAVILALDSDSATLFATVVIRDHAPEVPIVARVNDVDNVERIHRAGADFALSVSQVSGRLLAHRLLGRDQVEVEPNIKITRVSSANLTGRRLADLDVRAATGCSVVAVERGDEVLSRFDPGFTFESGDEVFVCGATEAVERWRDRFGAA